MASDFDLRTVGQFGLGMDDDFHRREPSARKARHRAAGRKDLPGTKDMEFHRPAFA